MGTAQSNTSPILEADNCNFDFDLPRENPNLCLEAILEILKSVPADTSNHHFQALAAGPLEELLVEHGETYIGRTEELARQRPEFRLLLNGVWDSDIKPSVIEKLSKYRVNKW